MLKLQVAAGLNHSVCLTETGSVVCWGQGTFGQLGQRYPWNSDVPVLVEGVLDGQHVVSVAAGGYKTACICQVGTSRTVYEWGNLVDISYDEWQFETVRNETGRGIEWLLPKLVAGALQDQAIVQIATGSDCTAGLSAEGKVFAWGNDGVAFAVDGALEGHKVTQAPCTLYTAHSYRRKNLLFILIFSILDFTTPNGQFAWVSYADDPNSGGCRESAYCVRYRGRLSVHVGQFREQANIAGHVPEAEISATRVVR